MLVARGKSQEIAGDGPRPQGQEEGELIQEGVVWLCQEHAADCGGR